MKLFQKILILCTINFFFIYFVYGAEDNISDEQKIIDKDINILPEELAFFDKDGNKHFFDEFDGNSLLIIFWATWINESPELIISLDCLKKDFRKLKFDVIAVSEDYQGIEKIKEFFNKHEIRHLKIYHDYKNNIYNSMKITNLPSFFLLTADSNNLYQFQGRVDWNDERIRNTLLGFIPGNPIIPKNTFSKTLLKFSTEYKSKIKKAQNNLIKKQEKDTIINNNNNVERNE